MVDKRLTKEKHSNFAKQISELNVKQLYMLRNMCAVAIEMRIADELHIAENHCKEWLSYSLIWDSFFKGARFSPPCARFFFRVIKLNWL